MMRINNFNRSTTGISLELGIYFNKYYIDQHFNIIARDYSSKGRLVAILIADDYYKDIDDFIIITLDSAQLKNIDDIIKQIILEYNDDIDDIDSWTELIKDNPRVELVNFYHEVFKYDSIKSIDAVCSFLDIVLEKNPINVDMALTYDFTDIYYIGNVDIKLVEKALSKPALVFDVYVNIYNNDISYKVYNDMINKLKNKYKHYELEVTKEELIDLFKQTVLDNTENKYKDIVTEQLETYFN